MDEITLYTTTWCSDCRRAKQFLRERGVTYREINVDEDPDAEDLILSVNDGRRKVPTVEVAGRFFACSPFDPYLLATELNIPLNPAKK
jgi:mycoredoxin